MPHLSRLDLKLAALLRENRVAALGTSDDHGLPVVSMTPFALDPASQLLIIHVSGLAAHTRHLQARPQVSLLIMQPPAPQAPVHDLARVTLACTAHAPASHSDAWRQARQAYLARFPEAEPMTALADFRFVTLEALQARQIAGFGAARDIAPERLRQAILQAAGPA